MEDGDPHPAPAHRRRVKERKEWQISNRITSPRHPWRIEEEVCWKAVLSCLHDLQMFGWNLNHFHHLI